MHRKVVTEAGRQAVVRMCFVMPRGSMLLQSVSLLEFCGGQSVQSFNARPPVRTDY